MDTDPLIIDRCLPQFDTAIAEHRIVDAPPPAVFAVARDLDFATVHTPLLDASFWIRTLPARLGGRQIAAPPHMRLSDGPEGGVPGWIVLGERPGEEIAFGAVGVFWRSVIEWRAVSADDFPGFADPGYGKIACSFSVRPYGPRRSLLTFDCRVGLTGALARRGFGRYWLLVRPFVGHVMRAALATVAEQAVREPLRAA
jgi:hypothetical protein